MNRNLRYAVVCIAISLLSLPSLGFDGIVTIKKALEGSKQQMKADSFVTVSNYHFFDTAYSNHIDTPHRVKNIITLKIDESSSIYLGDSFTAVVQVRLVYTNSGYAVDSVDKTFTINYHRSGIYTGRSSFVFYGGQSVTARISTISITGAAGNNPDSIPAALMLENEMQAEPKYLFSCSNSVVTELSNSDSGFAKPDELFVWWSHVRGADEYDLEWAYIDSSALYSGKYGNPVSPDAALLFENNASRISTSNSEYAIPLIYDNTGKLFFRVRAVQLKGEKRIEANWSSVATGGLGAYFFRGHERNLNWQSSISFAEDGKRKVVVQYFDGSLRSRQVVTKDNSSKTTVVSESFYDFQGRAVVQVLPAPTLNTIIQFTKNFNVGLNGAEYEKIRYDTLLSAGSYCSSGADAMGTQSGASKYYSTNNPDKTGFNAYIADAEGYPFVQTEYTQDNTGRISKQGGVGPTFRLGSSHETQYFYSTPSQEELDAIFGTEIGDKSHYFKTMIRDANGQYSISYTDMHGRTIATALAGTPPDSIGLQTLASNSTSSIKEKISDPASVVIKDLVMEHKKGIAVEKAGNYVFNYSLNPQTLQKEACNNSIVCYDCLYDLRITITDDCNNQRLPNGKAFDTTIRNFSLISATLDTTCSKDSSFNVTFSLFLPEGSYDVTKQLTVSRYAMNYYRDSVYLKKNTCKTLEAFILEQKELLGARLSCYADCQSCRDSVGTWSSFRPNYMLHAGIPIGDTADYRAAAWTAFNTALEGCKILCDSLAENDDIRTAMLLDITAPSGQYANPASGTTDVYSIFYTSDITKPSAYQKDTTYYLNESGQPDMVFDFTVNQYVKPNQLNVETFSNRYKSSWANALLKYHPEYCKLVKYEEYNASHFWDRHTFEKTDSYADAVSKGLLNPTNNTGTPFNHFAGNASFKDPLCNVTGLQTNLEGRLTNYKGTGLSMWSVACIMVKCADGNTSCHSTYGSVANTFDTTDMCQADLDMAWQYFRQMYLQEKKLIIDGILSSTCGTLVASQLSSAGHFVHFNNSMDALNQVGLGYLTNGSGGANTDTTAVMNTTTGTLNGFMDNNCESYAKAWIRQLAPCNYNEDSLKLVIIPRLVQVCKEGTDKGHPFGASSVKPTSTNAYRSFEAVLNEYNLQHGITNSYQCSPELITAPKPYDQQAAYTSKPIVSTPDSCECATINSLYSAYQAQGVDTSFAAFVLRTRNTVMSEADLAQLRALCDTTSSCNFLQQAINLPPALQCYAGDVCIPCKKMDSLYLLFKVSYPGVVPTYLEQDSVQQLKNQLFSAFMNNRLGFAMSAIDYLRFMARCKIDLSVSGYADSALCTQLSAVVEEFATWFEIRTAEGYSPSLIRGAFAAYFDSVYQSNYTYREIINLYLQICGGIPSYLEESTKNLGDFEEVDCAFLRDQLLVEFLDTYAAMASPKPYPKEAFRQYFNNYYGLFLSYETIDSLCYDLCGEYLAYYYHDFGIDQFDCEVIKNLIDEFGAYYDNLQQPKLYPRQLFADYYNYYFGTGYSYEQIDSIFTDVCGNSLAEHSEQYFATGSIDDCQLWEEIQGAFGEYFSEFENPPLCTTAFENFVNSYFGTHYNYIQIDSIYSLYCGSLVVCGYSLYPDPDLCAVMEYTLLPGFESYYESLTPPRPTRNVAFANYYNNHLNNIAHQFGPELSFSNLAYFYKKVCNEDLYFTDDEDPNAPRLCGKYEVLLTPVDTDSVTNCSDSTFFAVSIGTELYNSYMDSLKNAFEKDYVAKCLNAYQYETFTVTHDFNLYHYTLYYYDQAGNLVKTVPPKGVDVRLDSTWFNTVRASRAAGSSSVPTHNLITQYRYNTLNQVTAQQTPDAGISRFWYDELGRLVLSQNAKQYPSLFSYTFYDALGRIKEVGQAEGYFNDPASLTTWIAANDGVLPYAQMEQDISQIYRTQITRTTYDEEYSALWPIMKAKHLRNRVAWTAYYDNSDDLNYDEHASATFYTYDIHGNVDTLVQDYNHGVMADAGNRFKKLVYRYDLVSGKVNHVAYQPGEVDAFYHKYYYDAENRLTNVETSRDSVHWENDAYYLYYKHGPLARAMIGQQQVQGIDYAYTLQGWLKGVNGSAIANGTDNGSDMGGDGINGSTVARDAYGFALYYYGNRDYKQISTTNTAFAGVEGHVPGSGFKPLFNGNIAAMGTHIPKVGDHLLNAYTYDQLNRLVGMQPHNGFNNGSNSWSGMTATDDYREHISYDANGNILGYLRNGTSSQSTAMDSMHYQYYAGTNRLKYVTDSVAATRYSVDIDNQDTLNYVYDAIGNLIEDRAEGITSIEWTVYGKISHIEKTSVNTNIWYSYDAAGNRISKRVVTGTADTTTWYVRDASGNVMAVYKGKSSNSDTVLRQNEIHMYGSSRLGIVNVDVDVATLAPPDVSNVPLLGTGTIFNFTRGEKLFELSNHLGNVLVTVSDKKQGHDDGTGHIDYYEADVVTASDYYPFGMLMSDRKFSATSEYRYGFNGQEKTLEVNLNGNSYNAEFWQYSSGTAKRWNLDPRPNVSISLYAAFENNPILFTDVLGDSIIDANRTRAVSVFIVGKNRDKTSDMSAKRLELTNKKNPENSLYIEADKLDQATAEDIIKKLGADGYVGTLVLDYHRSDYDEEMPEKEAFFSTLANGYAGESTTVLAGMCWAGGGPDIKGKPRPDLTMSISTSLDKATVLGLRTEAANLPFRICGDYGVVSPDVIGSGKVSAHERKYRSTWTITYYNPKLKTLEQVEVKAKIALTWKGLVDLRED